MQNLMSTISLYSLFFFFFTKKKKKRCAFRTFGVGVAVMYYYCKIRSSKGFSSCLHETFLIIILNLIVPNDFDLSSSDRWANG